MELLPVAIGVGLAVSLFFSELFGLAAGGMVVPGYVALCLTKPVDVVLTLAAGVATFLVVHLLSSMMIVYGRRRTVLMILVGYLIGALVRMVVVPIVPYGIGHETSYAIIGFIIPGLIAIWIDRQGIVETIGALLTASVVVRLILILFVGAELQS
jgi:poly-gamma-glutamate biosynthesis protein PgsC/CapC